MGVNVSYRPALIVTCLLREIIAVEASFHSTQLPSEVPRKSTNKAKKKKEKMPMKWREGDIHSELEKRPVLGGTDSDGSLMYVGRAEFNGMTLPAKIIPARNAAYVSFDGQEIEVETFEYLSGKMKHFQWVPASNGTIAEGAVVAGWSDPDGEELYVGRASHEGSVTIGKIHPSQGCLYMAYGGEEIPFDSYEVLIYKRNAFTSSGDSDEDSE